MLERLNRGSTVNFRNFLLSDPLYVHGRTTKASTLLQINTERINGTPESLNLPRNNGGPPRFQQEGAQIPERDTKQRADFPSRLPDGALAKSTKNGKTKRTSHEDNRGHQNEKEATQAARHH